MIGGNTKSCGCSKSEMISNGKKLAGELAAKKQIYWAYRVRAEKIGKPFELSFDQFISLTQQSCHYCGLSEFLNICKKIGGNFKYNGIDRVDNTKGYTIENCVSCCKMDNKAKGTMSYEEYINHVNSVSKHLNLNKFVFDPINSDIWM